MQNIKDKSLDSVEIMISDAATEGDNADINIFFKRDGDNLVITIQRQRPDGRRYHSSACIDAETFIALMDKLELQKSTL